MSDKSLGKIYVSRYISSKTLEEQTLKLFKKGLLRQQIADKLEINYTHVCYLIRRDKNE